jgi:hypothetical protein
MATLTKITTSKRDRRDAKLLKKRQARIKKNQAEKIIKLNELFGK